VKWGHTGTTTFGNKNAVGEIRQYQSTTINLLDIIHCPVFIKNNVSETGFCLRPQVKAYSAGSNR
jgi:hypothetical protein